MIKVFKKITSLCLIFLLFIQTAFAQSGVVVEGPKEDSGGVGTKDTYVDNDGNTIHVEPHVYYTWEEAPLVGTNSGSDTGSNSTKTSDEVPAPKPVDSRFESGGTNRSAQGAPAPSQNVAQEKYNKIIREHDEKSFDKPEKARTSTIQSDQGRSNVDLTTKANLALTYIQQDQSKQRSILSIERNFLSRARDQTNHASLNSVYQAGGKLLSDSESKRVTDLLISIVKYNQQNLFPIVSSNLNPETLKYQDYKQKLLKRELQQLFPEQHQKKIQELIQARKIVDNWRVVDRAISNSIFKSEFVQIESAIQTVQNSIDQMGLGPIEGDLLAAIDQFQQNSLARTYIYISNFIEDISNSPNYDTGESQKKFATEKLQSAFNSIYQQGDFLQAASDILEAKAVLEHTGPLEEPLLLDPTYFIVSAGILPLSRGLVRIGSKEVLTKVVTAQERSVFRKLALEIADSKTTYLGKTGTYEAAAINGKGNYFHIPEEIWKNMLPEERKRANYKFLDRAIARNDLFRLTHRVLDVKKEVGQFRLELEYMINIKKYRLSPDGLELIK